jgi:hypothetical protein
MREEGHPAQGSYSLSQTKYFKAQGTITCRSPGRHVGLHAHIQHERHVAPVHHGPRQLPARRPHLGQPLQQQQPMKTGQRSCRQSDQYSSQPVIALIRALSDLCRSNKSGTIEASRLPPFDAPWRRPLCPCPSWPAPPSPPICSRYRRENGREDRPELSPVAPGMAAQDGNNTLEKALEACLGTVW